MAGWGSHQPSAEHRGWDFGERTISPSPFPSPHRGEGIFEVCSDFSGNAAPIFIFAVFGNNIKWLTIRK